MKIKSSIINTNNHLNEIFPAFDSLNRKISLGFHLIDTFHNCFSFHSVNQKDANTRIIYHNKPDNIYKNSLISQNTVLVISNTSIKNNITTSVSHICRGQDIIAKIIHHTINVTFTKAKFFAIRCSINFVTQMQNIAHIVVITDAIPVAKHIHIFGTSIHPYQLYSITISNDLRSFFNRSSSNSISF